MRAFQPRPFCQRRAQHWPEPGGDGSPARLPEVAGLPAPEPGRPQHSLRLRAYWLSLILMDIRAPGPPQANYTLDGPGEHRVRIQSERDVAGLFRRKGAKRPTLKAHQLAAPTEQN